eukprot:784163-Pyramimonas_sp.AAC.1
MSEAENASNMNGSGLGHGQLPACLSQSDPVRVRAWKIKKAWAWEGKGKMKVRQGRDVDSMSPILRIGGTNNCCMALRGPLAGPRTVEKRHATKSRPGNGAE